MKKTITLILTIFALNSMICAQDSDSKISDYKNQITFSPFVFPFSEFQLNYERVISDNFGIRFSANYHYGSNTTRSLEGFKQELQFKYFFSNYEDKHSLIKMHFSPFVFIRQIDINLENPVWDYDQGQFRTLFETRTIGGGILFGADFTFKNKFNMSLYFGGGIRKTQEDGAPDTYSANFLEPAYSGVFPRAGFDFGFVF